MVKQHSKATVKQFARIWRLFEKQWELEWWTRNMSADTTTTNMNKIVSDRYDRKGKSWHDSTKGCWKCSSIYDLAAHSGLNTLIRADLEKSKVIGGLCFRKRRGWKDQRVIGFCIFLYSYLWKRAGAPWWVTIFWAASSSFGVAFIFPSSTRPLLHASFPHFVNGTIITDTVINKGL